jgi:DNA-binding protein H-NS
MLSFKRARGARRLRPAIVVRRCHDCANSGVSESKPIPALAIHGRVVAPGMVGFGYTDRLESGKYSLDGWVRHTNRHSPSCTPTSVVEKRFLRPGTTAIIHGQLPIAIIGENMSEKLNAGYRDLLAQRQALDQQIEALRSAERGETIAWIFEHMALFQIKPEDLVSRRGPKKHAGPIAAKYCDPDSGATWSGRGRAPGWMADQDREKFLIAD